METSTKVLIVTIVKDDLIGLMRTIQCVKSQTYFDIKQFIIDGNSGASTVNFLRSLPENILWISEPDNGIYEAMNKWRLFSEDFDLICWLNAGDLFSSDDVIKQVVEDYKNENWNWFYGNTLSFSPETGLSFARKMTPFRKVIFQLGINWIPHGTVFMTREFAASLGAYRLDIGVGADQEFLIRASQRSLPHFTHDFIGIFSSGGIHSTLKGMQREKDWHNFRKLNECFFLNNRSIDRLIMPCLSLYHRIPRYFKTVN